jgi:phage tail-like protein
MAPNNKKLRNDPLPVFCFHVFIQDVGGVSFFKSVSGLKYEMDVTQYREGGQNATTYQLFNGTKWSNVTLKQGYCKGSKMLEWRNAWLNPMSAPRRDVTITILDTSLTGQQGWKLHNCMPVKWEMSEFDASKSELAIETIELAHEGITLEDGSKADLE